MSIAETRADQRLQDARDADARAAYTRADAKDDLAREYMDACSMPLITTVSTPGNPRVRVPFIEVWTDDISERRLAARAISILYRDPEGKKLLEEMAQAHGEWFADDALEAV